MFSLARDAAGSYGVAAAWFALIPIGVAIVAATLQPVPTNTDYVDAA